MMDFHAAMETFAEAWVAANTQTPINTDISPQTEVSTMRYGFTYKHTWHKQDSASASNVYLLNRCIRHFQYLNQTWGSNIKAFVFENI